MKFDAMKIEQSVWFGPDLLIRLGLVTNKVLFCNEKIILKCFSPFFSLQNLLLAYRYASMA